MVHVSTTVVEQIKKTVSETLKGNKDTFLIVEKEQLPTYNPLIFHCRTGTNISRDAIGLFVLLSSWNAKLLPFGPAARMSKDCIKLPDNKGP